MSLIPGKTLKEELVNTKLESDYSNQLSSVSNNNPFVVYKEHFELYMDYENIKTKNDPITSEINFWINNIDKFENLEPEFILFWMRKLINSNPKVLDGVRASINIEDTTLQTLSDCIGNIIDQDIVIDSRYTPMFDINFESNTPVPYNSILDNKINFDYKKNVIEGSLKVNSLFNQNIFNIVQQSSPNTSHGGNLVTDFTHINRIVENKPTFYENITSRLKGSYETYTFLQNYKLLNNQFIINVNFIKDVEGKSITVDLKNNKIESSKGKTTNKLLG